MQCAPTSYTTVQKFAKVKENDFYRERLSKYQIWCRMASSRCHLLVIPESGITKATPGKMSPGEMSSSGKTSPGKMSSGGMAQGEAAGVCSQADVSCHEKVGSGPQHIHLCDISYTMYMICI